MGQKERKTYDKDSAKDYCRGLNILQARVFCPIIMGVCNEQCVCLIPATYYEINTKGKYYITEAYCDNAMLTGNRVVQNQY